MLIEPSSTSTWQAGSAKKIAKYFCYKCLLIVFTNLPDFIELVAVSRSIKCFLNLENLINWRMENSSKKFFILITLGI